MKKSGKFLVNVMFIFLLISNMTIYASADEGEPVITEPVSYSTEATAITLYHQHSGDATCEGGCYAADYHVHTGNSATGGGCYTIVHSHTCNGSLSYDHEHPSGCWNGTEYVRAYVFKCDVCGRMTSAYTDSNANSYRRCECQIVDYYSTSCGYEDGQILGYSMHCGMSEETEIGTLRIDPSESNNFVSNLDLNAWVDGDKASGTDFLWNTGASEQLINVTSNGTYSCMVSYMDYANTYEKEISIEVKNIDNVAPEVTITDIDSLSNLDITVDVNAIDPETQESRCSGLAAEAYSWDKGNTWTNNNYNSYASSGEHEVWVRDSAGNVTKKNFTINIDKNAPTVNLFYEGGWTGGSVTITANATDEKMLVNNTISGGDSSVSSGDASASDSNLFSSGLAAEAYSWDSGNTWTSDNTFTTTSNGTYSVLVRDNAGNIGSASINIENIDNNVPIVTIEKQFPEIWPYYEGSMQISLMASDYESGLPTEPYSWDGGLTWTSENIYSVNGSCSLQIIVRDNVGNIYHEILNVEREAAPSAPEVHAIVIPVEPTPPEPDPEPEPEAPKPVKEKKEKKVEEPAAMPVQIVEIQDNETPTYTMPQFIAAASASTGTAGGMVFFIVFWIFRKCTLRSNTGKKVGKLFITKKGKAYKVKIPKKYITRYGENFEIELPKKFVKTHLGKPIDIWVYNKLNVKNVSEKIKVNGG